jgi:CheY-like chemotaxis protein
MENILIIDDSIEVRVIARVLRTANHRVTEAANGAIGPKLFQHAALALAITDMVMPETDGFEAIQQLRGQIPKIEPLPTVVARLVGDSPQARKVADTSPSFKGCR